jgi:hypothetical protein
MNKLIEIRNQEMMCRERALLESERRDFWLAKAEEWGQRALDEIAFQFRESNGAVFIDAATCCQPASTGVELGLDLSSRQNMPRGVNDWPNPAVRRDWCGT